LDRDGVINVSPPRGEYINTPDEFNLIPTIVDWIRLFNTLEYLVIVVTNQRGIALGTTRLCDLDEIHDRMREELSKRGARIDEVYFCPHGISVCNCRKPRPGMILAARDKFGIDLRSSVLIGDSAVDRELARNCGLRFVQVADGRIQAVM
jgi:D-glycero-D-manno-heptose 1,7-bisphosphate phosphatase